MLCTVEWPSALQTRLNSYVVSRFVCRSVDPLVSRSVGPSVSRSLVSRSVGRTSTEPYMDHKLIVYGPMSVTNRILNIFILTTTDK
jgi:hypothetical protein